MKKRFLAICCSLLLCFSVGCASGGQTVTPDENPKLAQKGEWMDVTEYDREAYLIPYWHTREVYNETVLFVGEEDAASLLYTPSEIVSVRNYGLNIVYEEGKDYVFKNGKLCRLPDSAIPYMEVNEYYRKMPDSTVLEVRKEYVDMELSGVRYLKYGETDTFTKYQIAVSYKHDSPWRGTRVSGYKEKFDSFFSKAKSGNAKILFFGDSITVGCNASGTAQGGNISPFCESWPIMVTEYLQDKLDCTLTYVNKAIGGTNTRQGLDRFDADVIPESPDLLVIAYGMNDRKTPVETYRVQIQQMIERYHAAVPEGNVLLVSPMLPNIESNWYENQEKFEPVLAQLAEEYAFCALAPVTSLHKDMLAAGKRYRDFTGNNVNHPNDFIVRLYGQVILKTILGEDFCSERYE